ncbi:MAG TPA: hypothetical protein VHN77_10070 [Phycisphaerales bacterium]|nr:hypothetical protein [Phycisphaerales bacterium]
MDSNRIVWVLVGVSGLAMSLSSAARADDDQDALSGPKVRDTSVQGERRTLTGKGDPKLERAGRLQPRMFERALGVLRADDAPADLKLSAEQDEKIRGIREDFHAQMKSYIEEHKAEIHDLRASLPPRERGRVDEFMRVGQGPGGPGGPEGDRPPRGRGEQGKGEGKGKSKGNEKGKDRPDMPPPRRDEMMDEDAPMVDEAQAESARTRLKELLDGAPKPADAHARVMAILSDAQRTAVNAEVERIQKEAAERARTKPGDEAGKGERPREEFLKNLTPEEREKLKSMSPEERREFVKQKAKDRGK